MSRDAQVIYAAKPFCNLHLRDYLDRGRPSP
jgi:hypothetical protein